MSDQYCTILGMTKYYKYTWVCTGDCDALIEYTFKEGYEWPKGALENTCPCKSICTLVSVVDATIAPNKERKKMETLTSPSDYNPNQLVTYKSINNGQTTYPIIKVVNLEWELEEKRNLEKRNQELRATRDEIIEKLTLDEWYSDEWSKSEILANLCRILGHEPKKHIRITADVRLEVDYEIPLEDAEDFDARDFLQDNISVDSYHGDLDVDLFEVVDASVYED